MSAVYAKLRRAREVGGREGTEVGDQKSEVGGRERTDVGDLRPEVSLREGEKVRRLEKKNAGMNSLTGMDEFLRNG